MAFDSESDLHDFLARTWTKERVRAPALRNSWRFNGGQNVQTIPSLLFAPVISGIPTQGQTLTTTSGTWTQSPTSYAYQWTRNGSPIGGATSVTYTLQAADLGDTITVEVIATNQFGNSAPAFARGVGLIPAPLGISGTPVTTATTQTPYAGFTVSGSGGWTPYRYNVVQGNLPLGVNVNGVTGLVAGVPQVGGTYPNIVIQVTDPYNESANLAPFTLNVSVLLTITGTPVTTALQNQPYTPWTATGHGGSTPYVYSVSAGSLPTGITLDPSTGIVSGTPTGSGTSSGIVITVTDALSNTASLPVFSIVVTTALSIAGTPVNNALVNVPYAGFTVSASGGYPGYTYSVTAGALPTGIALNPSTGQVSGTPTVLGTQSGIVITATDSQNFTASLPGFSITVGQMSADKLDFSKTPNSQYIGLV